VANDYSEVEQAIEAMAAGAAEIDRAITAEGDATRLIAQNVGEAGHASISIQESVAAIVRSVRSASTSARELDQMANDLRGGASELGGSVAAFMDEVRAA
jgi:methyl-accepting chemotaxis protein